MTINFDDELAELELVQGRAKRRRLDFGLPDISPAHEKSDEEERDIIGENKKSLAYGSAYSIDEDTLRTDLSQVYVNSSRRPQNFVLNAALQSRFQEYPKLKKLIELHAEAIAECAIPPTYLSTDLHYYELSDLLPTRFDCILIDPPEDWTWEQIGDLKVPQIAANPSFIWIWCGKGNDDGLERGRALLAKWGYRRCEDIVWLKTNRQPDDPQEFASDSVFAQSKEHCLMGIKGTVRRSTDADFVHCNVDIDVLVAEEDEQDSRKKPVELYHMIENFCLGNRRLELFGSAASTRRGWLTIGNAQLQEQESDIERYNKAISDEFYADKTHLAVLNKPEIDALRPKSPPPRANGVQSNSGGGIGRNRLNSSQQHHSLPARPHFNGSADRNHQTPPLPVRPTFQGMPLQHQSQSAGSSMNMPGFQPVPPPMFNPMMFNPMVGMMNPATMGMPNPVDWTSFFQQQSFPPFQQPRQ